MALDGSGAFVVVWDGYDFVDLGSEGIFARRFDAAGVPLGGEFQVDVYTNGVQNRPSVARDADGDFVVVWASHNQDGEGRGIFARRFNAAGMAQAAEFQVNAYTSGHEDEPAVTMADDGRFVVAWESYAQDGDKDGIFARRFNAAGVAQAAEFQVNAYTTEGQSYFAIGMDADGDFVVSWESYDQDGFYEGIFARRFNSAGSAQATEFQVSNVTVDQRVKPSVDLDADGDFVITYAHNDGNFTGIFTQRFDSAGSRLGVEFQANTRTTGFQRLAAVALDPAGGFVVTWQSYDHDGSANGVFAQRFSSAGSRLGVEIQVNSYTAGEQENPALAIDGDGDFIVVWQSEYQDGSDEGIFAQRFATLAVLDVDGNGVVGALTDGLLVLRHLFGFTGTTLTAGVLGAGCTRCAPGDITAYLTSISSQLNVDGNAFSGALTDGILVVRFLFGFTGTTLTDGAVGPLCSRCAASTIIPYLQNLT